eukprot:TRINITY_DN20887_c0_g5_i1.p1 TRINITY_DN20887_c0_g5~~TRINITY_DN20887_c0_g5_i1.p1  ORF type:complete len:2337 (+),score=619.14 TRINITY_DN20887_c0_g5_i1:127-7137(+)
MGNGASMRDKKQPIAASKWEPAWDPRSKRWYFQDRIKGQSTWDKPSDFQGDLPRLPPAPPPDLQPDPDELNIPEPWQGAYDSEHKRLYYFNRETGVTTWNRPGEEPPMPPPKTPPLGGEGVEAEVDQLRREHQRLAREALEGLRLDNKRLRQENQKKEQTERQLVGAEAVCETLRTGNEGLKLEMQREELEVQKRLCHVKQQHEDALGELRGVLEHEQASRQKVVERSRELQGFEAELTRLRPLEAQISSELAETCLALSRLEGVNSEMTAQCADAEKLRRENLRVGPMEAELSHLKTSLKVQQERNEMLSQEAAVLEALRAENARLPVQEREINSLHDAMGFLRREVQRLEFKNVEIQAQYEGRPKVQEIPKMPLSSVATQTSLVIASPEQIEPPPADERVHDEKPDPRRIPQPPEMPSVKDLMAEIKAQNETLASSEEQTASHCEQFLERERWSGEVQEVERLLQIKTMEHQTTRAELAELRAVMRSKLDLDAMSSEGIASVRAEAMYKSSQLEDKAAQMSEMKQSLQELQKDRVDLERQLQRTRLAEAGAAASDTHRRSELEDLRRQHAAALEKQQQIESRCKTELSSYVGECRSAQEELFRVRLRLEHADAAASDRAAQVQRLELELEALTGAATTLQASATPDADDCKGQRKELSDLHAALQASEAELSRYKLQSEATEEQEEKLREPSSLQDSPLGKLPGGPHEPQRKPGQLEEECHDEATCPEEREQTGVAQAAQQLQALEAELEKSRNAVRQLEQAFRGELEDSRAALERSEQHQQLIEASHSSERELLRSQVADVRAALERAEHQEQSAADPYRSLELDRLETLKASLRRQTSSSADQQEQAAPDPSKSLEVDGLETLKESLRRKEQQQQHQQHQQKAPSTEADKTAEEGVGPEAEAKATERTLFVELEAARAALITAEKRCESLESSHASETELLRQQVDQFKTFSRKAEQLEQPAPDLHRLLELDRLEASKAVLPRAVAEVSSQNEEALRSELAVSKAALSASAQQCERLESSRNSETELLRKEVDQLKAALKKADKQEQPAPDLYRSLELERLEALKASLRRTEQGQPAKSTPAADRDATWNAALLEAQAAGHGKHIHVLESQISLLQETLADSRSTCSELRSKVYAEASVAQTATAEAHVQSSRLHMRLRELEVTRSELDELNMEVAAMQATQVSDDDDAQRREQGPAVECSEMALVELKAAASEVALAQLKGAYRDLADQHSDLLLQSANLLPASEVEQAQQKETALREEVNEQKEAKLLLRSELTAMLSEDSSQKTDARQAADDTGKRAAMDCAAQTLGSELSLSVSASRLSADDSATKLLSSDGESSLQPGEAPMLLVAQDRIIRKLESELASFQQRGEASEEQTVPASKAAVTHKHRLDSIDEVPGAERSQQPVDLLEQEDAALREQLANTKSELSDLTSIWPESLLSGDRQDSGLDLELSQTGHDLSSQLSHLRQAGELTAAELREARLTMARQREELAQQNEHLKMLRQEAAKWQATETVLQEQAENLAVSNEELSAQAQQLDHYKQEAQQLQRLEANAEKLYSPDKKPQLPDVDAVKTEPSDEDTSRLSKPQVRFETPSKEQKSCEEATKTPNEQKRDSIKDSPDGKAAHPAVGPAWVAAAAQRGHAQQARQPRQRCLSAGALPRPATADAAAPPPMTSSWSKRRLAAAQQAAAAVPQLDAQPVPDKRSSNARHVRGLKGRQPPPLPAVPIEFEEPCRDPSRPSTMSRNAGAIVLEGSSQSLAEAAESGNLPGLPSDLMQLRKNLAQHHGSHQEGDSKDAAANATPEMCTTLRRFFLDAHWRGLELGEEESPPPGVPTAEVYSREEVSTAAASNVFYVHNASGIGVWSQALCLAAPGTPEKDLELLFVHLSAESLEEASNGVLAGLPGSLRDLQKGAVGNLFGPGLHATRREPEELGSLAAAAHNCFVPGLSDTSSPAERWLSFSAYCVPLLAPKRYCFQVQSRATPQMRYGPGRDTQGRLMAPDADLWVIQVPDEAQALQHASKHQLARLRAQLQHREATAGRDDNSVVDSVRALARCLQLQGVPAEAEKLYRRVVQHDEATAGRDHSRTLTTMSNLALCLGELGQLEEAERLHRRVVVGRRRNLGDNNSITLVAVGHLATCLYAQHKVAEAQEFYRHLVKAVGPPTSPSGRAGQRDLSRDSLCVLNNLAACLSDQNKLAEAEPLYRFALEGFEKLYGPDHPDTLVQLANFASCLGEQGRAEEAKPLLECALEGCSKALGSEHPRALRIAVSLAGCLADCGKAREAERRLRDLLARCEEVLGASSPATADCRSGLVQFLKERGRPVEAQLLKSQC